MYITKLLTRPNLNQIFIKSQTNTRRNTLFYSIIYKFYNYSKFCNIWSPFSFRSLSRQSGIRATKFNSSDCLHLPNNLQFMKMKGNIKFNLHPFRICSGICDKRDLTWRNILNDQNLELVPLNQWLNDSPLGPTSLRGTIHWDYHHLRSRKQNPSSYKYSLVIWSIGFFYVPSKVQMITVELTVTHSRGKKR